VAVDLLKSAGRLSLAMGMFTVRQVANVFSASGRRAVASIDDVTDVAIERLKGLGDVAHAVGTNLQSGIVDAASDLAGIDPSRQAPVGAARGLSMSITQSATRRLLAFSTSDIYDAIGYATSLPQERIEPVVHGAAFAFALINMTDLPHMLRHSAVPFDPSVRAAFQNGLVYALVFLDWFAPGVVANWRSEAALEAELIDLARKELEEARQQGFPLAARLAHPRT